MCVTLVMQVEISEAVSSQRATLEDEHRSALEALQQQVVALENQHGAALVEITDLAAAKEKQHEQQRDVLGTQHQQQLQVCVQKDTNNVSFSFRYGQPLAWIYHR